MATTACSPDTAAGAQSGVAVAALRCLVIVAMSLCLLPGCSTRRSPDLLEARLRQQEDQLFEARAQLEESTSELAVARREADALRAQLASDNKDGILPEQADLLFRVQGIRFHALLTGGLDRDDIPGDELLSVVIQPHDAQGELLKVPGTVQLELLDMSLPESDRFLGRWQLSADQCRQQWHRGFVGSGYQLRLPWQQAPRNSELTLHARLTTTDGRQFDASTTIKVVPPPAGDTARLNPEIRKPRPEPPRPLLPAAAAERPASGESTIRPVAANEFDFGDSAVETADGQAADRSENSKPPAAGALPSFSDWLDNQPNAAPQ